MALNANLQYELFFLSRLVYDLAKEKNIIIEKDEHIFLVLTRTTQQDMDEFLDKKIADYIFKNQNFNQKNVENVMTIKNIIQIKINNAMKIQTNNSL
jgi:hypothetical protein